MWKVLVSDGETRYGPDLTWIDVQARHALDKLAGVGVHVPPSLASKIDELQGTLPADKVAFYNRALGAFESFGLNRNGDGFARHELDSRHDTFVKNAHYFKHHVNKDPAMSRGRPVASALNEETDMVDLIIVADRDKCEDQIQHLESGRKVPTSMGAKVAFDVCTHCDHKAKTRAEYCEHVKQGALDPYGMGKVLPNGQVLGVMNPNPNFFDISDVIVGAAAESETLMKVASNGNIVIPSAELADMLGLSKWAEEKESAITKEVPGEIDGFVTPSRVLLKGMGSLSRREKRIPDEVIDGAVKKAGLDGMLSASTMLGIVLSPGEFSRATKLGSFDHPSWQEIVDSEPLPPHILGAKTAAVAASFLYPFYDERSCHQPALLNRASCSETEKVATRGDDERARAMYLAYRRSLVTEIGDAGGSEGEYMAMKCAGTSSRNFTEASRAYVASAFLQNNREDLTQKVLDRIDKFANHQLSFTSDLGRVTGSMADELGVEALDSITVQSLRNKDRH